MTIENYFERRIRPISEDIKSQTQTQTTNNLIDEDQLLSIEAYEIALDLIKRNNDTDDVELESLLFSIGLLENINKTRAVEYTIKLLKDKYKIDYHQDLDDIDVTDEEIDAYLNQIQSNITDS